jgi:type I restriction enzyme S subunit
MSFPRYPKYKESGVEWLGQVPEHWSVKRLKQVFREREERSRKGEELLLSVSAYTGVTPRADVIDEGDHLSRAETLENYKICYKNDLVVNIMLAWNRGLAVTDYDGIVSPAYCVYRIIDDSDPRFLNYLVRSDRQILYFKAFSSGVIDSRLRIYPETFGGLFCACPPLEEQAAIADFLDRETAKIDGLIAEQEQLIKLLKEKRQAVISHAVTKGHNPDAPMKDSGIEWLGKVPAHWTVSPLSYRYSVQLGKMLDSSRITGEHLRPYLRVFDVQWGEINTDDLPTMDFDEEDRRKFALKDGDLLVNEGGSYPGRSALWRGQMEECYYQKALHRVRVIDHERDDARFLLFLMFWAANYGVFSAGGNEATIEHLPAEKLRRHRIPFPAFEEQRAVVEFLEAETAKLDTLQAEAQKAITLLQERRSSLISAAVTGQIDVRGLQQREAA